MPLMRLTLLGALCITTVGAACRPSNGTRTANAADTTARAGAGAASSTSTAPQDTALERRADHARIEGSANAPVWVVEVSDFQCPYCREWHEETYPIIKKEYVDTGKIRLAYINFPLPAHRNAWPAAEAAMCAAAQNKFWPMHDALFATQPQWESSATPSTVFDSLATSVGVDTASYHACVTHHALRPLIQADVQRAEASGVNATPSFLIDGHMISGAQPADVFRAAIDRALARTKK